MICKQNGIASLLGVLTMPLLASPSFAVTIDNNLPQSAIGYVAVDVVEGGESRSARITTIGSPSGRVFENADILFSQASFIDVGTLGNSFRLSGVTNQGPTLIDNSGEGDQVLSSGFFTGDLGNVIDWSVSSTILDGSSTLTNVLSFSARSGTLGDIRFYQAIDQDILGVGNNVIFTQGSVDSGI